VPQNTSILTCLLLHEQMSWPSFHIEGAALFPVPVSKDEMDEHHVFTIVVVDRAAQLASCRESDYNRRRDLAAVAGAAVS